MSQSNNGAMTIIEDEESSLGAMMTHQSAEVSTMIQLAAATLDKRIVTARQFPRSITTFLAKSKDHLREDVETAMSAEYAKPLGGKVVKGASIRLLEVAALYWRNLDDGIVEATIQDKSVRVTWYVYDLEQNNRSEGYSSTSILDRNGQRYKQHLIETTVLATASKARRNALEKAIPKVFVNQLLKFAKSVAAGDEKTIGERRDAAIAYLEKTYGVEPERVFLALGVAGKDDLSSEHLDDLRAMMTAIKDKEATVEEFFPGGKTESKTAAILDKLKERQTATKPATEKPADKPLAAGEIDPLTAALDEFKDAGGVIEEFAESNGTTPMKIRASKGKEREMFTKLLAVDTKLAAEAAAKGKGGDGSLPGMSNEKSGAAR